jgi:hypothetical protein
MTYTPVDGWDATGADLPDAPKTGQAAGYVTGLGGVPWSNAQKLAHPGFVQIDQSPAIETVYYLADFFDLENGAVTIADLPELLKGSQAAWAKGTRPGQRWPGVYCSQDSVTDAVNALVAGGIDTCPLGVADYSYTHAEAVELVTNASGPFPIVWVQYNDNGAYDVDVFSKEWLNNVSRKGGNVPTVTPKAPPGQWLDATEWTWEEAVITGTGTDGNLYCFAFDPSTGTWIKQSLPGLERD